MRKGIWRTTPTGHVKHFRREMAVNGKTFVSNRSACGRMGLWSDRKPCSCEHACRNCERVLQRGA